MISLNKVNKSYKKFLALKDVSFNLKENQVTGLIGKNGSGKSTLLKIITGLITDHKGSVEYQIDKSKISLASETFDLPSYYTVEKILKIIGTQKKTNKNEIEYWCERLEITQFLKTRISKLSHGNKQRVNIACALIGSQRLIILDEPNNGLDPTGFILLRDIIKELKEKGVTIVIASHLLNELEGVCDHIIFISDGKILLENSKSELVTEHGSLENAFIENLNN